jgi:hypothetical protein
MLNRYYFSHGLTHAILQHVDVFVYSMALEEGDTEKHDKILSLKLWPSEWERAGLFLGLLAVRLPCLDVFDRHKSQFLE